jgi:Na+/H+-dicarboxylate symporter
MKTLPLHYQILIALVAGTIIGVIINPGEIHLPDTTEAGVKITARKVHIVEDNKSVSITYTRQEDGHATVSTDKAADAEELAQQFPQWKELYEQNGGGYVATITAVAKTVGDLFLRLLRMITIPLIVTSLITGIASLENTARLKSMFGKTLGYYFLTSVFAITTGIIVVNVIRPGVGAQLPGGGQGAVSSGDESLGGIFVGMIERMIPSNPIQALANGDFLSIITFSILLGLFIIRAKGKSGDTLKHFFQSAFEVMMGMTMAIIKLAPIGVFAFMLYATASQGLDIFKTLAWYMLAVSVALLIHAVVILPLILKFVAKRSPWEYFKAMSPALMTAFSTASSNGTLPLTISCVEERAGVSNRVSSFVLPLGATINMDGTALYEAVAVLFIAQATPGFAVTLDAQIIIAITALLASVGAAGIPHAGLVMMAIVLQAVGLPLEAQGIIIAVDRVLDMCRTSINVWSDSCGCAVLDRFESQG